MQLRFALTSLVTAIMATTVIQTTAVAKSANSSFAGSKMVSTRPAPTPPRTQPQVQQVDRKLKLNCYHTRERNQFGVPVPRAHCG